MEAEARFKLATDTAYEAAALIRLSYSAEAGGPKENRTLHTVLAKQRRQPWYMRAQRFLERLARIKLALSTWQADRLSLHQSREKECSGTEIRTPVDGSKTRRPAH